MRLPDLGVHRTGIDRAGIPCRHSIVFAAAAGWSVAVMFMRVVVVMRVFASFALGNQVHAALWAIARSVLPDFGMHGAGPGLRVKLRGGVVVRHLQIYMLCGR